MSYRTIKRLLGETSLERKCRFLFGGGLMLLITGSFYFYAWLNARLVYEQNVLRARMLVIPILLEHAWSQGATQEFEPLFRELAGELKPPDEPDRTWQLIHADPASPRSQPDDQAGFDALARIRQGEREVTEYVERDGQSFYHYYAELRAGNSCIRCHELRNAGVRPGDLLGMVKITFPLDRTQKALAMNNAVLLATAIVTAFLAMLAVYAMVRYVIVKPVLHLKDVSDEIAHGNLDLRADIRTGDEFEELSHAFNRMLRHLVTIQEELREVNANLDAKVDELAQLNLRLYEMNKLKDDFLATISHELRTPLNSILGFSDVLAGFDNLNDKQKRYLNNIQSSGRDLMCLINDVLDLAKIESGKLEVQPLEFSLADLVERQAGAMLPLAEKRNINLTWDVVADLPPLRQDAGKLQQILNNLLSNAIKFTPDGGRVRVRACRHSDDRFDLVVDDTGIGIPLEEQETIFEKFRQGKAVPGQSDTLTREYGGTGLGLSIVKELSKLLGGEVLLDSEFGKGSVFTVRLPFVAPAAARREPAVEMPASALVRSREEVLAAARREVDRVRAERDRSEAAEATHSVAAGAAGSAS